MSSRQRALQYAAQVSSRKSLRTSTQPDLFGKTKSGPSSYAFQNNQRGPVDDTADETRPLRNKEKEIAHDEEKDVVDKSDFTSGTETGKAPLPAKTTSNSPAAHELHSAFAKCWTIVDTIDIPSVYHEEKSGFFPSSIAIFEVLSSMEEILNGNEELRWVSPNYFSLPVRVYYSVIFYVQCLRAKEQAGTLRKSEGSWLRAFFRRFKDASLPIAGPLVPIFTNIVSCLPDDDQFDYVFPTIPETGLYQVTQSTTVPPVRTLGVHSTNHLLPNVPLVASLLQLFCTLPSLNNTHFDSSGAFVPFRLTVGGNFAGFTFPAQNANHHDVPIAQLLTNPALSHPLPEGKDRLNEIHGFWKRSKARTIPTIPANVAYEPTGPGDLTLMTEYLDWFQPCVDMANVQVKFFSDSTNLSAIPTVGGQSSTVLAKLKFTGNENSPTEIDDWYPDTFSAAKAGFTSTSAKLDLDHKYAAAYALTNVELDWLDPDNHKIGSPQASHRNGPFWSNTKVNFELEHPVPVMTGIYTMIQTQFYDAHGNA